MCYQGAVGAAIASWTMAVMLAVIHMALPEARTFTIPWILVALSIGITTSIVAALERSRELILQRVRDEFNCVGPVSDDTRRLTSL